MPHWLTVTGTPQASNVGALSRSVRSDAFTAPLAGVLSTDAIPEIPRLLQCVAAKVHLAGTMEETRPVQPVRTSGIELGNSQLPIFRN